MLRYEEKSGVCKVGQVADKTVEEKECFYAGSNSGRFAVNLKRDCAWL
jgi:hypothetical protein